MVSRNRIKVNDPSPSEEVAKAKASLREKGWSWRGAAKELGYSYTHVAHTLTLRRYSRTLIRAIRALPKRKGGKA